MNVDDLSKLHNTQAEVQVLAAILFNPYLYEPLSEHLSSEIFNDHDCQETYEVIRDLADEGRLPDMVEIATILEKRRIDVKRFILEGTGDFSLTMQKIAFLTDLSIRRRMMALLLKGQSMVVDPTITLDDVAKLTNDFDKVVANEAGEKVVTFGEVVGDLMNDIADRMADKGEKGIMTGLHIFDSHYGWHDGDLIIVAGSTSMGKSTLASTIAYNVALEGTPVAYYSMEMTAKQLVARMSARGTEVSASTALYAKLNPTEYQKVFDGTLAMKGLPIYFDEYSKTNFTQLCKSVKRLKKKYDVKVVFIDYLQILVNGSKDNREATLGDMARDLKRLAVEEGIVVCALSQLNRSDRDSKSEPRLNQMRGSGQIEEACDMGVLIHRPNLKNETATITIAKGRNIGLAKEKVKFHANLSYFSDFEEGDPSAPYTEKKEELPF